MKVVRMLMPFLAVAALASCSSIDNAEVDLIPPELTVRQLGGAAPAGNKVTGPLSVNLRVNVYNPSAETITLKRLEFSTVGSGAYTVSNASHPCANTIKPDQTAEVETWVPAVAEDTIIGSNGPVTMRVTAFFGSEVGQFRKVYTVNMNADLNPNPKSND